MMNILLAAAALAVLGLILGIMIGYAAKKFAVSENPVIEEVAGLLPGANCGGCGYAGCADLAKAIVCEGAEPSRCVACNAEILKKISVLTGKAVELPERKVAVVYCMGDNDHSKKIASYNGLSDCRAAASLNGGGKGCRYGCIGLGSCARNCPFGAIEMRNGLAIVHPELCTGCGVCESICPRKLIHLVPANSRAHIFCNSLDKPAVKRKYCSVSCLACRKCVKTAPEHFNPQGFLVRAIHEDGIDEELIRKIGCPVGCLRSVTDVSAHGANEEKEKKA